MFRKARLKLTAWYLAIIMLVSVTFSVAIYRVLINEVIRVARSQQMRIERLYFGPNYNPTLPPTIYFDTDLLAETQRRLIFSLILINSGILVLAASVGYILAGKTLSPIQDMMDEQSRFISDASHELKTPLTALKSSMEVYLRDPSPTLEEARSVVTDSITDINRLQALSESLLALSAYQQPLSSQLSITATTLGAAVAQAMERTHAKAILRRITIKTIGAPAAKVTIQADPSKLADLTVILLDNAIKYSKRGGIVTVRTAIHKDTAVLSVSDNGIGIAADDIPHIFDRFYRADAARTHADEGGYGLGLSIAQHIARLHQGTLTVTSQDGKGTSFILSLPRSPQARRVISSPFRTFSVIGSTLKRYGEKIITGPRATEPKHE